MNPEDRVLVGVIRRKRDFEALATQHWYRIPFGKAPKGIHADWLAFFLSGKTFKEKSGTIGYYARRTGLELVRRRDLLPDEADHARADELYHKIQIDTLQEKNPPILNQPNPYRFAFIYTTGDRFIAAQHTRDLYSRADYYVDRVFHVLLQNNLKPLRTWEATSQLEYPSLGASVRILCENGEVIAATQSQEEGGEILYLSPSEYLGDAKKDAQRIIDEVERRGGPRMLDIPVELL